MFYHSKEQTINDFVKKLSQELHKTLHNDVNQHRWHFHPSSYRLKEHHYQFQFGSAKQIQKHYVNYEFRYTINIDTKLSYIQISVVDYRNPKTLDSKKSLEWFQNYLANAGFEGFFVFNSYQFNLRKSMVFGEKAERIKKILQSFEQSYHDLSTIRYHYYQVEWDFKSEKILFTHNLEIVHTFKSQEEIDQFKKQHELELKRIEGYRDSIIEKIKEVDSTCYYDYSKEYLYIFNENVPFWIRKVIEKGKEKYKARFYNTYYRNQSLEKLVNDLETRFETLVKKNRLKAAVSGKSTHMIRKLLYELYNCHYKDFDFNSLFDCTLTEGELNIYLLERAKEIKKKKLDSFFVDYYQMYLRSKKVRNRIKFAHEIAGLYIFTSATKIFLLKKEEFDALVLPEKWRTKKDRLKAEDLEKKKEKLLTL